jgi:cell division protein FtsB
MKPVFEKIYRSLRNKYVVAGLIFAVWICFLDQNSIVEHIAIQRNISRMERQMQYYRTVVRQNNKRLYELKSDSRNLEKFARERYLMRASNEDVFLVVE